jgi:hypothetical protein
MVVQRHTLFGQVGASDAAEVIGATHYADAVGIAISAWFIASVLMTIAAFLFKVHALGLALIGSLIGGCLGLVVGAAMGLELEESPFGAAVGASAGLVIGGVVGLLLIDDRRWSRGALLIAGVAFVTAGVLATFVVSRALSFCWHDPSCHFPAVPAMVMVDGLFLAGMLWVIAARPER